MADDRDHAKRRERNLAADDEGSSHRRVGPATGSAADASTSEQAGARTRLGVPALALGIGVIVGWVVSPSGSVPSAGPGSVGPGREAGPSATPGAIASGSVASRAGEPAGGVVAHAEGTRPTAAQLAEVRRLVRERAWERPPGQSVRDALAAIEREAGAGPAVTELREEVAERLIADAVALRYAARPDVASKRVRFALELAPGLLGGQAFLADLQREAEVAGSEAQNAPAEALPRPTHVPSAPPGPAPALPTASAVFDDR